MTKHLTIEEIARLDKGRTQEDWTPIRDYGIEILLSPYEIVKERYSGVQIGNMGGFSLKEMRYNYSNDAAFIAAAPQIAKQYLEVYAKCVQLEAENQRLREYIEGAWGLDVRDILVDDGILIRANSPQLKLEAENQRLRDALLYIDTMCAVENITRDEIQKATRNALEGK